jgi:hypothetical protein
MPSIQRKSVSDQESHSLKGPEELAVYFDGEQSIYRLRGEERTRAIAEAIRVIIYSGNDADVPGNTGGCPNFEYIKRTLMEMDAQRVNVPRLTREDIDKAFIYAFDHEMIGPGSKDKNPKNDRST